MTHDEKDKKQREDPGRTDGRQGVDKDHSLERAKKEKVTTEDLKGKKVDADPSKEQGKPTH